MFYIGFVQFQIQSFCGSVLDPLFRDRSRIHQILSLRIMVPYLSFKTRYIPHSKRIKKNFDYFQTMIENYKFHQQSNFSNLHVFSAFGLQSIAGSLIINQDTFSNPGFSLKKLKSRVNYFVDKESRIENPCMVGFTVLPYNFYHFMTDLVLPYIASDNSDRKLFLPFKPMSLQIEILNFFQINFINSEFQANHEILDAKILPTIFKLRDSEWVKSSNPNSNYDFNLSRINDAKKKISQLVAPDLSNNPTKVFLSRRGATRSPEGILEIEREFELNGFIVYNAEDFLFTETVKIFQNARLIVGIHGASLTNMVLVQNDCQIIELEPVSHKMGGNVRPVFELLARANGFSYRKIEMPNTFDNWKKLASQSKFSN